jgi:hypothetical protein
VSLFVVLLVAALTLAWLIFAPGRRAHVEQLIEEVNRSDDEEELAKAEEEVRDLDVMATPEDATQALPDWGPGVPRKKRGD